MSRCVSYCCNYDKPLFLYDLVNDTIWKSFWIAPTNVLNWMTAAILKRIDDERVEHRHDFFDEFIAETWLFPVIPIGRFKNVVLRLGSRDDCPFHVILP